MCRGKSNDRKEITRLPETPPFSTQSVESGPSPCAIALQDDAVVVVDKAGARESPFSLRSVHGAKTIRTFVRPKGNGGSPSNERASAKPYQTDGGIAHERANDAWQACDSHAGLPLIDCHSSAFGFYGSSTLRVVDAQKQDGSCRKRDCRQRRQYHAHA